VTNQALARARAGEEDAFRELTDPYRRELPCTSIGSSGRSTTRRTCSKRPSSPLGLALRASKAARRTCSG
jgi:hypothetical protein